LDSVDAVELVVALEKEFALRIQSHEVGREAFASVAALAAYVEGRLVPASVPQVGG
jgi:acyl carrier protein